MVIGDVMKKKVVINFDVLWEVFLKNVDIELSNIYIQKVVVVKVEIKEMGEFIKSEDMFFVKVIEFGGFFFYYKFLNWQEILSIDFDYFGVFYIIIYKVFFEKDVIGEIGKVMDVNFIQILYDVFEQLYGILKFSNEEDFIDWVGIIIINLEDVIFVSL